MLDFLAILTASANVLLALLLAWGLSEKATVGHRASSVLAPLFLVSTAATVYVVARALQDGPTAWLLISALPPATMVALLLSDRDALWGNFPPPASQRALQRLAAVTVLALPGILAWYAG